MGTNKGLENNKLRIMVYGVESFDFKTPPKPIENNKFVLEFCPINTEKDFSDYDGVIFFGETFEGYGTSEIVCENTPEKLKRIKQLFKLIKKDGFICILINKTIDCIYKPDFIGYDSYPEYYDDTSLSKTFLNDLGLKKDYREYVERPLKHFKIFRDEFKLYLDDYGVTHTCFEIPYNAAFEVKPICKFDDSYTGMIINNQIFLLPCHAVDKDEKNAVKLFTTVATAIANILPKLAQDIPSWLNTELIFPKENELLTELGKQKEIISKIESDIEIYKKYKGCLAFSGDMLVDSVAYVLEKLLNLKVTKSDDFKENLKLLLPEDNKPIAIVEVKGVNSGISRENINQVDSHRERLKLPTGFPAILIMNVKMNATSLGLKDLEVASEHIKKAVTDNILILRTLDLLNLIFLEEVGKISKDRIIEMFKKECGWLKATQGSYEIKKD